MTGGNLCEPQLGLLASLSALAFSAGLARGAAAATPEERTARYLASIHQNPSLLLPFLRDMPKGRRFHITCRRDLRRKMDRLRGSGQSLHRFATFRACCRRPAMASCAKYTDKPAIRCAYQDHVLYNHLVDAWSMRNWNTPKIRPRPFLRHLRQVRTRFAQQRWANQLSEVNGPSRRGPPPVPRAHAYRRRHADRRTRRQTGLGRRLRQNARYAPGGRTGKTSSPPPAPGSIGTRPPSTGFCVAARLSRKAGCAVTVRYLYQVLRGLPPRWSLRRYCWVELVQADARFVGLNLVMPEDWYVPMRDFDLHMNMIDYLHGVYPRWHISLHAGELAMGLVPPEGLRFHIRESIERGHAERIGHGVSVMDENDSLGLLKEMAQRKVLVEICLTSNDLILGVEGANHPLRPISATEVPVALATDDEGVLPFRHDPRISSRNRNL